MFSIHRSFLFVFAENSVIEITNYPDAIVFEKLRFKNVAVHTKPKSGRSQIPSGLRSVLEKLRFRDG